MNSAKIKTDYTKQLSDYVANLTYDEIPEEVRERAKMIALQTIGVSLGSKGSHTEQTVQKLGLAMNGGESSAEGNTATCWISGQKLSAANAALVNGALADILDWEDCSWTGHPSASIIPVAWVMSEAQKKSGKDFITAIVAAYEVYQRIAMAVQPPAGWNAFHGWGLTSWQIFGGIVPAVKLLGLDSERVNQALGVGAQCSPIPSVIAHATMSDLYHVEHGMRSHDGICAAQMVKLGIDNNLGCFDDEYAYSFHMTSDPRPEWYTKDLGKRYLTMETLMKHWPANMWLQTPLELCHKLVTEHDLKPEDIREIILDPATVGRMTLRPEGYESMMLAQFSIPFALAAMICNPQPGAAWYSAENLSSPRVLELAKKVHGSDAKPNELLDSFATFRAGSFPEKTLIIRTNDGGEYRVTMAFQPGHPNNMMSRSQFVERFRIQAAPAIGGEKMEQAIDAICNIERYDDISPLSALLF
ncbi:MAG: MmgE/PrpD family protein [Clostridia bacterium]|nr:MmgE/PrpD family protein [Clostridia bacterium]